MAELTWAQLSVLELRMELSSSLQYLGQVAERVGAWVDPKPG